MNTPLDLAQLKKLIEEIEIGTGNHATIANLSLAVPALIAEVERLRDWHAEQDKARAVLAMIDKGEK